MSKTPKTPLPRFAKWGTGLWVYMHDSTVHFASKCDDGWAITADDRTGIITRGHPTKAAAVRAAECAHRAEPAEREAA